MRNIRMKSGDTAGEERFGANARKPLICMANGQLIRTVEPRVWSDLTPHQRAPDVH
jgi:hypothetical protein